ncbi:hypothetical protein B0A49_02555 [Cryomyces minteri]|uniref:Uncharacterized protein n=1 Tax=Cryomyces minteri TaxID=331657 RepID=A0A4U0XDU3_9PEZI|nr:hypothetical protein B0A49_02555 [Cryomyces minteri]
MAFGILDDKRLEIVPGTACLADQRDLPHELHDLPTDRLKHGKGRFADVLLVPQPSDSPNDPLNRPLWKKDMILLVVGLSAAVVGAYGHMLGPGFVVISEGLNISANTLAQSTAWLILTIGLCVFIANPLAKIYGKRPIYIYRSPTLEVYGLFLRDVLLWAFLIYGTTLAWIVVFSVMNGVIFEFRLVLMLLVVVLGTVGVFGFGATAHYQTHWSGPVLTYGIANMALAFASTCVFGYVVHSYPRLAEEADWLFEQGALAVFNILGACFLAVCALTVPLWVFGKKIRSWIARNKFLNNFMTDL